MFYVIDRTRKYVSHEGNEASCREYVATATALYNVGPFYVAHNSKDRDAYLKTIKGK